MKIGIAGYGSIGQYQAEVFGRAHEIVPYDPPLGIGTLAQLDGTDFVFVCVPTPSRADGSCDTSVVEEVAARVRPRVATVCRSTLAVGTTERVVAATGRPFVYVPEYAGESAEHPYRQSANREFFIYGGEREAASRVRDLFESMYGPGRRHFIVEPRVAEIAKYMENAFLAMKVAFCNEFYDLCRAFGVPYDDVRAMWLQDGRVGESHTRVTEERGYGGKCLPKDVAAIRQAAAASGVPMEIMEAVASANERHRAGVGAAAGERALALVP